LQWPLSWNVSIHQATPIVCEEPKKTLQADVLAAAQTQRCGVGRMHLTDEIITLPRDTTEG
jgi:hypothetical protein